MVKLITWVALNAPKRLVEFDPILALPALLTEQDVLDIINSCNSIFWEHSPHEISLFDYAYLDKISGLVYSNKRVKPSYITFHFSALPEDRLYSLHEANPSEIIIDYLYVSVKI
jgi:hypothetical protein